MGKQFKEVKDSGKRQNFDTGSVRDTDEGKGSPHLMAGEPFILTREYAREHSWLASQTEKGTRDELYIALNAYTKLVKSRVEGEVFIFKSIHLTCNLMRLRESSWSAPFRRLSQHYQNGAKKYSANNWRKGQPVSRYYDSALRHFWSIMDSKEDEDHYSALLWNLAAIVQTKIDVGRGILPEELDNYPFTLGEVFKKQ